MEILIEVEQADIAQYYLNGTKLDRTVGFVDSENYMLRGISPGPESRPRSSSLTGCNVNKIALRESVRCLADAVDASTTCARVLSFHSMFCSCTLSCCCMCGTLCLPDCHGCYHKVCSHAAPGPCQKNPDPTARATVDTDKVSPPPKRRP